MPRKRSKEDLPGDASPLIRRIVVLLELIWQGNISRMAKGTGVSHPVLSRVLRAQQEPPSKLLEALARWPGMNVRWLFAGEGEPLSERHLWGGGGRFCPIAKMLLPGAPGDHPEKLTWTSLPVANALYSETAYWFEVPADHRVAKDKNTKMKPGDYLLVETASAWTGNPDRVKGRLCPLRVRQPWGQAVILGEVGQYEEPFETYYPVNTFGLFTDIRLVLEEGEVDDVIDQMDAVLHLRLGNVAGVCIKLDRIL